MASLPPRSQPRRRETSSEASSSLSPSRQIDNEAVSIASEDSQTVLLDTATSKDTPDQDTATGNAATTNQSPQPDNENDVRKCWICFNDETEDSPMSSEWRSPCPCALVAHEACLLDWIADLESPTTIKRTGGTKEIKCPQCKSEIHVARPRDYVVDSVRSMERLANYTTLPMGALFFSGAVYSAALAHGALSIIAIFDADDARKMLEPLSQVVTTGGEVYELFRQHWRLIMGLPLIPPVLVLSRTSIADVLLPFLPAVFFATSTYRDSMLSYQNGKLSVSWPPSAALSFAVLPYIRMAYNSYWDLVWRPLERKWYNEIRPRSSSEGQDEGEIEEHDVDDGMGGFGIEVDVVEEEWEHDAHDVEQPQAAGAQEIPEVQGDEQAAGEVPAAAQPGARPADAAPAQAAQNGVGNNQNRHVHRHRELDVQLAPFISSVMGALVFPGISGFVGELLRWTLPRSLTTVPAVRSWGVAREGKPVGFLQTRWGRSIVGGCLAVALKDMLMVYVRWKMATNHRHRRVLNYDKKLKRVVHGRP